MAVDKSKFDNLWFGLISGLLGPVLGYLSFYLITSTHMPFYGFNRMILNNSSTHSGIISISLIFNLLLFFIAMRKDWLFSARGVIFATLLYAPFVVFFKYG